MASTLGGGGRTKTISGINVTPLVDVVMVLLVILMVASTYIVAQTLKVQLPKAGHSDGTSDKPITITLQKDGVLRYDGDITTDDEITRKLKVMLGRRIPT